MNVKQERDKYKKYFKEVGIDKLSYIWNISFKKCNSWLFDSDFPLASQAVRVLNQAFQYIKPEIIHTKFLESDVFVFLWN